MILSSRRTRNCRLPDQALATLELAHWLVALSGKPRAPNFSARMKNGNWLGKLPLLLLILMGIRTCLMAAETNSATNSIVAVRPGETATATVVGTGKAVRLTFWLDRVAP